MKKLVLVLIFLLSSNFVFADEAQHRKLAEELLGIMKIEEQMSKVFDQIENMQNKLLAGKENSEKFVAMQHETMDLMKNSLTREKLKGKYIDIYASTFTEQELIGLINFYRSPIGQKYIEKAPEIMRKNMQIAQEVTKDIQPEMAKIMKKYFPAPATTTNTK